MDPSPKPPQAKKIYQEHDYVMEDLKEGKFSVARFHGQIRLYVPKDRVEKLGKEVIKQLAEDIYTKEVLESFAWTLRDYAHSLQIELPPQESEKDDRVERLITAIENHSK